MSVDVFIIRMNWNEDALWERLYLSRDAVVADILQAQIPADEITCIWRAVEDEAFENVTEEVAQAVAKAAGAEQVVGSGGITLGTHDFVHDFAGAGWARGLRILDKTMAA